MGDLIMVTYKIDWLPTELNKLVFIKEINMTTKIRELDRAEFTKSWSVGSFRDAMIQ